jgi:hypothetical protein
MKETIFTDILRIPQPYATISHYGGSFGRGGYWSLDSTVDELRGRRFSTAEQAEREMTAEGWRVIERRRDGYGATLLRVEHCATTKRLAELEQATAAKWQNAEPCFLRYGELPPGGHSRNHRDGTVEAGVSVYRGEVLPSGETRVLPTHQAQLYGALRPRTNIPLYIVTGREVGAGSDGEPVLADCRIVRRVGPISVAVARFIRAGHLVPAFHRRRKFGHG